MPDDSHDRDDVQQVGSRYSDGKKEASGLKIVRMIISPEKFSGNREVTSVAGNEDEYRL